MEVPLTTVNTPCVNCGQPIHARYYALDRNIESVSSMISNPLEGEAGASRLVPEVTVHSCIEIGTFCDAECWQATEPQAIIEHGVHFPYPEQNGLVMNCSRCGRLFHATRPHVVLVVMDIELDNNPWLTSAKVHHAEALAHFCSECEAPDYQQSEFELEALIDESGRVPCTADASVQVCLAVDVDPTN